jgi:hypothetical protein
VASLKVTRRLCLRLVLRPSIHRGLLGSHNFRVTFFHGWPPTEILGAKTVLGTALFATWNYAPVAGQVYGGYIQPWANGEPCGIVAAYFTYGALMVIPPGAPDLSKITPES